MGKSVSGAVWLNPDMLSAYDYWQYWRNTEDADVGRFLKLYTTLPMDEIARLERSWRRDQRGEEDAGYRSTAMLHGREDAEQAAETARKTFEEGALAENLPTIEVPANELEGGIGVLAAFGPDYAKLVPSSSEARRQIKSGGLRVNDQAVSDDRGTLSLSDVTAAETHPRYRAPTLRLRPAHQSTAC